MTSYTEVDDDAPASSTRPCLSVMLATISVMDEPYGPKRKWVEPKLPETRSSAAWAIAAASAGASSTTFNSRVMATPFNSRVMAHHNAQMRLKRFLPAGLDAVHH